MKKIIDFLLDSIIGPYLKFLFNKIEYHFGCGEENYYNADNQLHRVGGPAHRSKTPIKREQWHQNGKMHREGGPALIIGDYHKEWYYHGHLHRDDGPALERNNQFFYWFQHGKSHRDDGPARINIETGINSWYINDIDITDEVSVWLTENNYTHPLTDEQIIEFQMRWA